MSRTSLSNILLIVIATTSAGCAGSRGWGRNDHTAIPTSAHESSAASAEKNADRDSNESLARTEKIATSETPRLTQAEELQREIEADDGQISPLLKQQIIALLERQRRGDPAEAVNPQAEAISLAPKDPPTLSPTVVKKNGATLGETPAEPASAQVGDNAPAPQITVNVHTAPAPAAAISTNTSRRTRHEPPAASNALVASSAAPPAAPPVPAGPNKPDALLTTREEDPAPQSPADSTALQSEDASWQTNARRLSDQLERELQREGSESTPEERLRLAVALRILYLVTDRGEDAARPLDGLDKSQQEYWKNQLASLMILVDAQRMPVLHRRAALALRHLRDAANELAAQSSLDVRNLAFCSKVDGFGTYQEFPKPEFKRDQEVLLYVEVDNFAVEQKSTDRKLVQYETELKGNYQVLDAAGRRIADIDLPLDKQMCRNHRRDYFIAYRIYMPKHASPGNYTLQLTIEDLKAGKFGQGSLELIIKE